MWYPVKIKCDGWETIITISYIPLHHIPLITYWIYIGYPFFLDFCYIIIYHSKSLYIILNHYIIRYHYIYHDIISHLSGWLTHHLSRQGRRAQPQRWAQPEWRQHPLRLERGGLEGQGKRCQGEGLGQGMVTGEQWLRDTGEYRWEL